MAPRSGGDAVERLVQLCYSGLDVEALRREALARLRRVMTVDAAFFGTVDPATLLFTSAHPEEALAGAAAGFLANELGGADVNHFAALAATPGHVRSLDAATHGDRGTSERYREVMAPLALGDELRAALVCDDVCWGVLCLHRERAAAGFGDRDVRLLRRVAPHLARGLRRAMVTAPSAPADGTPPGPGVLVVGRDGAVLSQNPEAEAWLAAFDGGRGELPPAVRTVVARVGSTRGVGSPEVVVRTRDGRWATVTASVLQGADPPAVAVVLAAAPPHRVESVLLAAHGLTPAQRRVTELVLRGRSTRQIVDQLHLSEYTVQEHLRAAFDKVGVNSRRELMTALIRR
ncbi:LuxR C-terminal-related transcriptional regulator [Geodermatophilus sp. URMC 64]